MIVRIRSNIGTVKLTIEDEEKATGAILRGRILEELQRKTSNAYILTQDLSFDAAGARTIHLSKTLSKQGIRHGCMVYCRVEEGTETETVSPQDPSFRPIDPATTSTSTSTTTSTTADKDEIAISSKCSEKDKKNAEMVAKKDSMPKNNNNSNNNDVIDLIDSSDEEKTNNGSGDDDDVQVISPRTVQRIRRKVATVDNPVSKARKRQRSLTDDHSSSTKLVAREANNKGGRKNDRNNYPSFQIASYNVWFGPPDAQARQVFPKERMAGIVESLRESVEAKEREAGGKTCPLLFVGLQELTASLVQYLQPQFETIGYRLYTQPLEGFYGIGIAVPTDVTVLDLRFVPYRNTKQGRGFLFARTPTLLFATTHLESWTGHQSTGSKEREVQIVEAAGFCREQLRSFDGLELAVIAGDLNWDDERKRKSTEAPNQNLLSVLPDGWKDAGTPFDYTYDSKENPMLNGNLRRRFDRCLYMSNKHGDASAGDSDRRQSCRNYYKSMGLQKIGKQSIPSLIWNKRNTYNDSIKKMAVNPSDHFGIMIHFSNEKT